jgi:5'-nucleotidase
MKRRSFIKNLSSGSVMLASGLLPLETLTQPEFLRLTIMHTNDVHSRIDPFPDDGSRNAGLGGASRRASLIKKIRSEADHTLLFDAGDIFQGTPYFNFFGGELEMKLMSSMGYDAATIGNHDFDAGIDGLDKQLPHANFPLIISNYDFKDTILKGKTLPYKIFQKKNIKIGVFGVGIELKGLVPKDLYKETVYLDPIKAAQEQAHLLKHDHKCDYVICLSHLGYKYDRGKVSDRVLALNTVDIDLIIGGHTHTFLREPDVLVNNVGKQVLVNQVGWAGIMLGQIEIFFERNFKNKCISCRNTYIGSNNN